MATSHTITDLMPETEYKVSVCVWPDVAYCSDELNVMTMAAPPPETRVEVTLGTVTHNSIALSWGAIAGAEGYEVGRTTRGTSGGRNEYERLASTVTSFTIEDLEPETVYDTWVCAIPRGLANCGGQGAVKTLAAPPAAAKPAPVVTYLTPMGRDTIKVVWTYDEAAKNASTSIRFDVGWTDAKGTMFSENLAPQNNRVAPGGRAARHYVLENLKINQGYLIAVRAVHGDAAGNALASAVADWRYRAVRREKTPAPPAQVQNVSVAAHDGQLMVTWDAVKTVGDCMHAPAGSDPCGYRVEWRAANQSYDDPQRQKDLKGVDLATRYTIPGLTNGTEYHVVVSSYNERSTTRSPNSAEARQTPMAPAEGMLEAPNPVEAVAGDMEVTVKWTGVEEATGYTVQWRTASQSYDSSREHSGFYAYRSGELVLSHTVEDLENGMDYMFRVMAMGDGGMMSGPSDEVSAMPMMPTPALPVFGALVLGAGLVAAGRRRLRARRQRLVKA
jgi:hypothetical protein